MHGRLRDKSVRHREHSPAGAARVATLDLEWGKFRIALYGPTWAVVATVVLIEVLLAVHWYLPR